MPIQVVISNKDQLRERRRLNPRYLLDITLGNSGPTLHFSTRDIMVEGVQYERYIHSLSGIEEEINRSDSTFRNTDLTIFFLNRPYMAYTFLSEVEATYPFSGAVIVISETYLDDNGIPCAPDVIFKGVMDTPYDIDLMRFSVKVSSMLTKLTNNFSQPLINKSTYPQAAIADLNKYENIIFGSVPKVKLHAIGVGGDTSISYDWTTASPSNGGTFEISEGDSFPAPTAFNLVRGGAVYHISFKTFLKPDGKYRTYFAEYNSSVWYVALMETSDSNPPYSGNITNHTLFGSWAGHNLFCDLRQLPDGKYRIYYAVKPSTYWELRYRDTTDANLPTTGNVGAEYTVALSPSCGNNFQVYYASIVARPAGGYRLYYTWYDVSVNTYHTAYQDTTDANLPGSANMSATRVDLENIRGTGYSTFGPTVFLLPSGKYRLYYHRQTTTGGAPGLYYADTTDSNLPGTSNLLATLFLDGTYVKPEVFLKSDGSYRLYVAWSNGSYYEWQYRDLNAALALDAWFTCQIDNEQVRVSARTGNILTIYQRGYAGTTISKHKAGARIYEVLPEYVYLAAGHAVKTIGDVYADGIRQTSGVSKYTGQTGNVHPSYPGKALVSFTIKPKVVKSVNIDISNPEHNHSTSTNQATANQNSSNLPLVEVPAQTYVSWRSDNKYVWFASPGGLGNISASYSCTLTYEFTGNSVAADYEVRVGTRVVYKKVNGTVTANPYNRSAGYSGPQTITATWDENSPGNSFTAFASVGAPQAGYSTGIKCQINAASRSVVYTTQQVNNPTTQYSSLTGDQTTDIVIASDFHADIDGYRDPSGIYGGLNALIERPDWVIKFWLVSLLGAAEADINTDSFTAAGAFYAAAIAGGYKYGFCLTDKVDPAEILKRLAFECRSTVKFTKGRWSLDVIPSAAPAAVKTISRAEVAGKDAKFLFSFTDIRDIVNTLTVLYDRNHFRLDGNDAEWSGTLALPADATSVARYGIRRQDLAFEFIRSQSMVASVATLILLQSKSPLLRVRFPVYWEHFALEIGQTFDISNPLYTGKKFYIEGFHYLDQFRAEVEGVEWWQ